MTDYVTKDSGERQDFESGARRDISEGKPRFDLIELSALRKWAELMGRGAQKYGARNWELGMPVTRFVESGLRHFYQYLEGDRTEDHLAAVLFNVGAICRFENGEWDDLNGKQEEYVQYSLFVDEGDNFGPMSEEASAELHEWILEVESNEPEHAGRTDMVNWDALRRDVEEGRIDGSTVHFPETSEG